MSDGQVLCLDTISERFVQSDGDFVIQNVNKLSLADVAQDQCLTVSNTGQGIVFQIILNEDTTLASSKSIM